VPLKQTARQHVEGTQKQLRDSQVIHAIVVDGSIGILQHMSKPHRC
jgi:hypothetical protein